MSELSHKQKLAILLSAENGDDYLHANDLPTSPRLPKTPKFKKIKLKLEGIKNLRLKQPKLRLKKNKSKLYG